MNNPAKRSDALVSICCADFTNTVSNTDALKRLAEQIKESFRFWEIILILDDTEIESYSNLLEQVENIRIFLVRSGTSYYRKRLIAAHEAIGDLTAIVTPYELGYLSVLDMLKTAEAQGGIVLAERKSVSFFEHILNPFFIALGRGAGFRVTLKTLRTMVFPRIILNQLMAHHGQELALRFAPIDNRILTHIQSVSVDGYAGHFAKSTQSRMGMLHKLVLHFAPRLLFGVALASAMITVVAFFYLFYAIGAWIFLPKLEPGWLTLSLMLTFTGFFLGIAFFGVSLGLQNLLQSERMNYTNDIVNEHSSVDIFHRVRTELNVDIQTSETDIKNPR